MGAVHWVVLGRQDLWSLLSMILRFSSLNRARSGVAVLHSFSPGVALSLNAARTF